MRDLILCFKCLRLNVIRTRGLIDPFVFACSGGNAKVMEPSAGVKIFESRKPPKNCAYSIGHKFYSNQHKGNK